ncbi:MAG: PQQ-binding-like beta-propeller repeat protein [Bradymonadales bacterium]|jgi:outer membrane protein assembly factor BamB
MPLFIPSLKACLRLAALAVAGVVCACSPQWHVMDASPAAKSAQTQLQYDWAYELQAGPLKYFGAMPLELGQVAVHPAGFVVAGSSHGLVVAIKAESSEIYWKREFTSSITAGPIIVDNVVYIGEGSNKVIALNAFSGKTLWEYDTDAPVEHGLSIAHGYVAAVNANNRIFLLNANDGSLKWRRERPRSSGFAIYGQASPYIDGEFVYVGFSDGYLSAFAVQDGSAQWMRELDPNLRFNDISGQIARSADVLYVATASGGITALNVSDGQSLWKREIADISGVQVFQDSLFISSNDGFYRLRASDGHVFWHNKVQDRPALSSFSLGKNYIYTSAPALGLIVIERKTGQTRYVLNAGTSFNAVPKLDKGALYLLSNKSVVYRLLVDDEPLI